MTASQTEGAALPFVGRVQERRHLRERCESAGALSVVCGPAGIGKSRLIQEVERDLFGPMLRGTTERTESVALWRSWLGSVSESFGAAGVLKPWPDHLQWIVGRPKASYSLGTADSADHIHDLMMEVIALVDRINDSSGHPPVMVFEDLHRASLASIEVLNGLVRSLTQNPVVISFRPGEFSAPHTEAATNALAVLGDRIELGPLSGADQLDLAARVSVDAAQVAGGGGVPLRIRWLIFGRSAPSHPPEPALAYGALLGREFDGTVVARTTGEPRESVLARLERQVANGILEPLGPHRYRFHHEEHRTALIQAIPDASVRHRDIARALLDAIETEPGADVARHALAGAPEFDSGEAIQLALSATGLLVDSGDLEGASDLAREALRVHRAHHDADPRIELPLLEIRARALAQTGRRDATDAIEELLSQAELIGDTEVLLRGALLLPVSTGSLGLRPHPNTALAERLRHALQLAGPEQSRDRAKLTAEAALQQHAGLENSEFRTHMQLAIDMALECGDPALAARFIGSEAALCPRPGDAGSNLEWVRQLPEQIEVDRGTNLLLRVVEVLSLWRLGRFDEADRVRALVRGGIELQPPLWRWTLGRWEAAMALMRGDIDRALIVSTETFNAVAGTRWEPAAAEYLEYQLGVALRERCEFEVAHSVFTARLHADPASFVYRGGLGWILSDMGKLDEARAMLAPLFERSWDAIRHQAIWVPFVANLAAAVWRLERPDWCARCVAELEPYGSEWILWGAGSVVDGPVALRRGLAAAFAGDLAGADRDLASAERSIRNADADLYLPLLHRSRAEVAILREDHAQAHERFAEAVRAARRLGLDAKAELHELRRAEHAGSHVLYRLDRHQDSWLLRTPGGDIDLGGLAGCEILHTLMNAPDQDFHVLDLAPVVDPRRSGSAEPGVALELRPASVQSEPLLDATALRAYRRRLGDLNSVPQDERTSESQHEIDFLVRTLRADTRPDGRSRSATNEAERARTRIRKSLSRVRDRIAETRPDVADDLDARLVTGYWCRFAGRERR